MNSRNLVFVDTNGIKANFCIETGNWLKLVQFMAASGFKLVDNQETNKEWDKVGKMKDLATNLYLVRYLDEDGKDWEEERFGVSRQHVWADLDASGYFVVAITELEGDN